MLCAGLPTPRELLPLVISRALESKLAEVIFQSMVSLCVGQDLKIDDDIYILSAGVRRYIGRSGLDEISRREASNEKGLLPRPQSAEQCHQDPLAIERVLAGIALQGGGLGPQNPILSWRRCSAMSFARPSACKRSR